MRELRKRSIAKAIVWRLLGITMMLLISFILTEDVEMAVDLTIWTNISSFIMYYLHERAWAKIKWGTF